MQSTRQKKVSRLLQKELSLIFQQQQNGLLENIIVSVTVVRVSPDLANANIFLSIFPVNDPIKAIKLVQRQGVIIRKRLGQKIKHQLRIIPNLQFHLDDSAAYSEEIDRLLKK